MFPKLCVILLKINGLSSCQVLCDNCSQLLVSVAALIGQNSVGEQFFVCL